MENNGGRRGVETRGRRTRRGTQTTKTAEIGHERKILRDTQKPNSNQIRDYDTGMPKKKKKKKKKKNLYCLLPRSSELFEQSSRRRCEKKKT
jgi:hypothetical protein